MIKQSTAKLRLLPALVLIFSQVTVSSAADISSTTEKLDSLFSTFDKSSPGCNVGLIYKGDWVYKKGHGLANLELDVPLDGSQVHRMASVSKQFTAMAVLLLAEEYEIDLESDIRSYLPELPDYGVKISINAMLGHFSGMGDYDLVAGSYEGPKASNAIELNSAAGGDFRLGNEDYLTIDEFYAVVTQVPLAQDPEASFRYSNLAYFLLSMLVEKVSGESLRVYAGKRIFQPLGMHATFFSDNPVEIVKNRASGYKRNEAGSYINDMTNLFWVGDGGLHTNLDDMMKWDQNFYRPTIGEDPHKLLKLFLRPNGQYQSSYGRYANGQFITQRMGHTAFEHGGGWLGTTIFYTRLPDKNTSLIMMCNDATLDIRQLVDDAMVVALEIPAT